MSRTILAIGKRYILPVLVDEADYEWCLEQGNWLVTHGARTAEDAPVDALRSGYAARTVWMPEKRAKRLMFMHKEILLRAAGPAPSPLHTIGDHINGVRLDNRRANLRWATVQMNARNRHGFAHLQPDLFERTAHA